LLVTAFPSPAKAFACANSVPGSKVLACYFAHLPADLPTRSALRLRRQSLVCPSVRLHPRLKPVAFPIGLLCRLCRLPLLPFRSFRSLGINAPTSFATVRSAFRNRPIFVRSPQPFHLKIRLWINVPDPLHFQRLAVLGEVVDAYDRVTPAEQLLNDVAADEPGRSADENLHLLAFTFLSVGPDLLG